MNFENGYNRETGEMILVDKPLHWTSFDAVKKVRYKLQHKLGIKKIKVGHAGTLDPLATGLVIISIGPATKKINTCLELPKTYQAEFYFGATTPSYDLETEIDNTYGTDNVSQTSLEVAAAAFTGQQQQYPPIFSAKWHNGARAYEHARKGEKIDLKPSTIEVHEFKLTNYEHPVAAFEISCSKGTYIRSLANDLGRYMQSGAYLKSLRRTHIGTYSVEKALKIEEIEKKIENLQP